MTEIAIVAVADWEGNARAMETYERADYFTAIISGLVGRIALNSDERTCLADKFDFVLRVLDKKPLSSTRIEEYLWNRVNQRAAIEHFKKSSAANGSSAVDTGSNVAAYQARDPDAVQLLQESIRKAALDVVFHLQASITALQAFVDLSFVEYPHVSNSSDEKASSSTGSLRGDLRRGIVYGVEPRGGRSSKNRNPREEEPQFITASELPIGSSIGDYQIVALISSSPWSFVYLVNHASGVLFAIKEFLPSGLVHRRYGETLPIVSQANRHAYGIGLRCFFNEGRALSDVVHPNLVQVSDCFFCNETAYIVMQYETGRSLKEHILRNRSPDQRDLLSERFIRRVFAEVMNGLRELHDNQFLHLGIRLDNILLGTDGVPILLGFDTARSALQHDISEPYPKHSRGFTAPERYEQSADVGPWTDVYSIGACIFTCMSGLLPQESNQRFTDDKMPQLLQGFRNLYSPQLISLVERCLRLNSLERPQSVYHVQKEFIKRVPDDPAFTEHTGARVRRPQNRIARKSQVPFGPWDPSMP